MADQADNGNNRENDGDNGDEDDLEAWLYCTVVSRLDTFEAWLYFTVVSRLDTSWQVSVPNQNCCGSTHSVRCNVKFCSILFRM